MATSPRHAVLHKAPARHPRRWLALAGQGRAVDAHRPAIRLLARGGHEVTVAYLEGEPSTLVPRVRHHRVSATARFPGTTTRVARALASVVPGASGLSAALRWDPWLGEAVTSADEIVLLDETAGDVADRVRRLAPAARVWAPDLVREVLEEEAWWRYLDHRIHHLASRGPRARLRTAGLEEAVGWLAGRSPRLRAAPGDLHPAARRLAHRLARRGELTSARAVLDASRLTEADFPPGDEAAALRALRTSVDLHETDTVPEDLLDVLTDVFASADASLAEGSTDDAADRASIGLDLMFHQRLHSDVPTTPLVESPRDFTAPLYGSEVGRLLTSRVPRHPHRQVERAPDADDAVRVALLPGSYPWHGRPAITALTQDPRLDVEVLALGRRFHGMGVGEPFVRYRLLRAGDPDAEVPAQVDPEQAALLERADVVVADWADKGAVWASLTLPPGGARMIVRVHSVDVLSAGVHLIDWTRVEDVIFVSAHVRDVFTALLGPRVAHVRTHVIPNIIPARTPTPRAAGDGRTLAMVGWAQRVKDPGMALDILAALLAREPGWRLRLIGSDFVPSASAVVNAYADAFHRRAAEPDLVDSIDLVGHTDDVPEALAGAAFILSTSLRESFHIGAMEGVAAGAMPVVRDWPAYKRHGGAAGLFPAESLFDSVEEAVEIIWALRDTTRREEAVQQAQEQMREVLDGSAASARLLEVVLR